MPRRIDISYRTIIFIAAFALALWVTFLILDILILLFVAIILTSALGPLVTFFERRLKLPKALGIVLTYIIIFVVLTGIIASFYAPLKEQSDKLISTLPPLLAERFNITNFDQGFFQQFAGFSSNIFSFSLQVFNNILTLVLLLVITFYLLMEREELKERIASFFPGKDAMVRHLMAKIEEKLGAWFRGQLFLTLIIGTLTYIGLTILGLPYALPLALLAGIMEVVPVIGPIISAIPAIGLAFTVNPVLAAGVAALYFIIQQLENNLIVPQIMKRAVGLNPLIVIIAIAVGNRLLGVGGALLAVPLVVVIQIMVAEILNEKKA